MWIKDVKRQRKKIQGSTRKKNSYKEPSPKDRKKKKKTPTKRTEQKAHGNFREKKRKSC